jgi:pimeloyl-ACP methyl ester carboxylesterase
MTRSKPPFVLVHGAFHGGWCWRPIAEHLRRAGHEVHCPTHTGSGERKHLLSREIDMETFVLDVLNVIEYEELTDVVLVGHSYGARPINGVADRIPSRIRRLVYLDGGMSLNGLSRLDAMPAEARQARIESAMRHDGGISVPPPPPAHFGVTDPQLQEWLKRRLTPQPLNAEATVAKLQHPIANGRPATYVRFTDPIFPSVEPSAVYAKQQQDWRYLEFKGGHDAIVTHPQELAELLLAEAQ